MLDAPSARYTFLGSLPRWLPLLPLAAFAVTLALTPLVPIYTDEVGWKIITARLFQDGGVMISLFPRCGTSFALEPPWFMMPTRAIEALAYADFSLMRVRIMGVLSLVAWMALTFSLLRHVAHTDARSASGGGDALWPAALLTAFLGLGALPFLLVLNRPEQSLLIGLTLLLLVPLVLPEVRRRWTDPAAALGCLAAAAAMLFAAHPKSLLFAPLILAGLFIAVRPWWLRFGTLALLGLMGLQTYGFWTTFNACPGDPSIGAVLSRQMVTLSDIGSDPFGTVRALVSNALYAPYYAHALKFPVDLPINWLPPFPAVPRGLAAGVTAATRLVVLLGAAVAVWSVAVRLWDAWRLRHMNVRLVVSLSCGISLAALASVQTVKHFYELAPIAPLAAVAVLVVLPPARLVGLGVRVVGRLAVCRTQADFGRNAQCSEYLE